MAGGLLVLVVLVYWRSLPVPLSSDARFLTYQNEWVRSGSGIMRFWTHDVFEGAQTHGVAYRSGYYRPVLNSLFWLEYRWAGSRDALYNLMEVLLHGLNAFLALLLVTALTRSRGVGLVAGILFAVHPINAFAASEPAARADVLFTTFYLSALLLFLRALDRERAGGGERAVVGALVGVSLLYALSLLSKEMGITLPAVLLLLVLLRYAQEAAPLHRWRWTLPAWGVFAAYLVWRFAVLDLSPSSMGYGESHGKLDLVLATLATIPVHLGRLLVPAGPSYPELDPEFLVVVGRGFADPLLWVSLGLFALVGVALVRWRREPEIAFCSAFFLVTYSPLLRVDNIGGTLDTNVILTQERWIYLPAVAFFAVVGIGVVRLASRVPRRWLVPAAASVVACVLAWEASVHAGKHEDPFARLRRLYAIPEQYLSRFDLANRYILYAQWVAIPSGDLDDAESRARTAEQLVPDSPITAEALAQVVARRGAWEEVRDLLTPWMYPTPEFLASTLATNFRVYDDWNRINPQVALLLARADAHLGDPERAESLFCDAVARGVSAREVREAAAEIPAFERPLGCAGV